MIPVRRSMIILCVACAACTEVRALEIQNCDMGAGIITAEGDTIPHRWGDVACKGTPPSTVCIYYDQNEYASAPASMRIEGEGGQDAFSTAVWGDIEAEGPSIQLMGWAKVSDAQGAFYVRAISACSGSEWEELDTQTVVSRSADTSWFWFNGDIDVPSTALCEGMGLTTPKLRVEVSWEGTGTAWLDNIQVVLQCDAEVTGARRGLRDMRDRWGWIPQDRSVEGAAAHRVYDAAGRLVAEVNRGDRPGAVWDGRNSRGSAVSPGVYHIVAENADGTLKSKRSSARGRPK